MHTRTLGQGLRVSAVGLGCMGMSQGYGPNPGDRQAMIGVLRDAVGAGINFFDTAEVYGPFVNEELVGEALAPVRDEVVIATKFGWRIEDGKSVGLDSSPDRIKRVADQHDVLSRVRFRHEVTGGEWDETTQRWLLHTTAGDVEAQAQVPLAMAEAFRSGRLGVMDYYRMENVQSDTQMRSSIAKPEDNKK